MPDPRRVLAVLTLTALVALAALPAQGAVPAAAPDPTVIWFDNHGTSHVSKMSALRGQFDYVTECQGVSPGQNTCTLVNRGCGNWIPRFCFLGYGWEVPPPVDPVGLLGYFVGSTHVVVKGTYNPSAEMTGECTWSTTGIANQFEFPPGPIGASCQFAGDFSQMSGTFTANFWNGFYDLHVLPFLGAGLPDTSGLGDAQGSWHAILMANFAG